MIDRTASYLNRLPFVRWDRCIETDTGLLVYGWIDRDDGRADFVLVRFNEAGEYVDFTTSSATRSEEIMVLLYGTAEGHVPCQRVADVFGDRVRERVGA